MGTQVAEMEVEFPNTNIRGAVRVIKYESVEACHAEYVAGLAESGRTPSVTLTFAQEKVATKTCWGWVGADDLMCETHNTHDGAAIHLYIGDTPDWSRVIALISHELDHVARHRHYMSAEEGEQSAQVTEQCGLYAARLAGKLVTSEV